MCLVRFTEKLMKHELEYMDVVNHGHPGTMRYNWFYYKSAIKGVLRPHRLEFKEPKYGRDSNFLYRESTRKRWHNLYKVPDDIEVPFTVYGYSGSVGMMAVLKELGINFRHLLHLKSEIRVNSLLKAGESYIIDYALEDVIRIKADKAAMINITKVMRGNEICMEVKDHFVIKNVPERYLERLESDETGEFRGITRISAGRLESCKDLELFIMENYARDYGRASGDKNIVHTTKFTSRLFGFGRPFIQGLCTANLIMSKLCMEGFTPAFFSIVFCRPVYIESRVILSYTDTDYRLLDDKDRVLCFGKISRMDNI